MGVQKKIQFTLEFDRDLHSYLKEEYPWVSDYRVVSKSLDARGANKGRRPSFIYHLEVVGENDEFEQSIEKLVDLKDCNHRPIIIGAGPAGLYAALRLTEYGLKPIIFERGDSAQKRMQKIAKFWRYGQLDLDTNVCFGEGGAGLFSDGKLITRVKSNHISYVMKKIVDFGAPKETAYTSNPHLGSNKIRNIIFKMSEYLKNCGVDIFYNTKVDNLLFSGDQVIGIATKERGEFKSDFVILATGHSAHEVYQHLSENGVAMKGKDFAIGVRIEHKREYLDKIQLGDFCGDPLIGSSRYRLADHNKETGRGCYSFCMCPGGYVLSSGTEKDGIVVNGMSNYKRSSAWSNSALVVSVKAGIDFSSDDVLSGIKFQRDIEKRAFELSRKSASGRELPYQRVGDFLEGKIGKLADPISSSPSKIVKSNLDEILPNFVTEHLRSSLESFDRKIKGFMNMDALLIAPETRTSSPVTISRDKISYQSLSHAGLYPCGEGAGFAGGITSSAVDGVNVADAIADRVKGASI
ncbi:MAG: NAD(P)-binding protein [Bacteriovoracaceae bacterium]|jgi:uncharacterized protein|nr:NAD(P)-binding protein [Bacteriovoracaceae bacterium]